MRTSTTALAALAALPLVAALAACSGGSATPSSSSPASPASSAASSGSGAGVVDGVSNGSSAGTARTGTARPGSSQAQRPTAAEALSTVRAYLTREVGMRYPVTQGLRWTGTDSAEVTVRARIPRTDALGPSSVVSLTRLRTVWFVDGVRTDGITVDRAALARPLGPTVQLTGAVHDGGVWRTSVTQDRYGQDIGLGTGRIDVGAGGHFTSTVTTTRPTGSTGSVLFAEDAGNGGGTLRATVVRVRFAPAPPAASCAPAAFLPVLKPAFDDPAVELYVAKANVKACRNGYAHVVAVPRANPKGHAQYDAVDVYLQDRAGRWHTLDYGSSISCDEASVAPACRALGEVK